MTAEYDIHRKSYKYGIDDWQLLVNILHEYGDKLTGLSRKISMEKSRCRTESKNATANVVFYTILFSSSFFTFFVLNTQFISTTYKNSLLIFLGTCSAVCLAAIARSSIVLKNRKEGFDIPIHLLEVDAGMISSRLESAIRLTITVSEQVEISLAKKLEMDLRIDEAKSALEYYYSVVGGATSI